MKRYPFAFAAVALTLVSGCAMDDPGSGMMGAREMTMEAPLDRAYPSPRPAAARPAPAKAGGGNFVTLDKATMDALAVAAGRWVQSVYTASRVILGNVAALQTVDACAQFDVNAGWP